MINPHHISRRSGDYSLLDFLRLLTNLTALLRLDTVHRILRGGSPALDADGEEGDGRDGEEGQGEEPPVDGSALGEAHQPLASDVPGERCGEDEGDEDEQNIAAAEHQQDSFLGGAEYLADANFLAAVLSLEERQTEDTDEGDDEANDAEE